MDNLAGKVAMVTGGASGNGRAIALALAQHGATVLIADLRQDPREGGTPTHILIAAQHPGQAHYVFCDVSQVASLEGAVAAADTLGGVDILVNNAGILSKQALLLADEASFDRMMAVNVKSVYFASQAAAKRMVAKGRGSIINLSSIAGIRGTGGYALYCATKGAVRAMTYALADELGPLGIRVNAIHPGIIETHMNTHDDPLIGTQTGDFYQSLIPQRRWGQPSEVAEVAVFLAGDRSSYVNGASLVVDGGYLRS